ncbi:MAG: GMC family oxidoreductase N-terminal domain-containing protein, partial [Gammaproteobacteria bacterium]|nr:GMC family oxidoreductase N-terminal domain-containing protein [Gammaproteobacteria bacterium]
MSLPNNPFSSENITANNWQLIDGEKVSDKVTLEADVVIVGTGAGGGIAAEILSKAGFKVVMVEEGPLRHSDHFDMKEKTAYPDLYQEAAARKTKDKAISVMQGRAVGGSTTVNWTSSFRTPAQTLKQWQTHHGVEGITEESMKPWFEWVEKRLNINPWPVPPNMNNEILRQGATQLGWSSGVIARNVNGCANLGYCGTGCPINAKQSMLVTTIPAALNHGATLFSRTRVEKILTENDKATGVEVKFIDHNGQIRNGLTGTIKAKHVVMSAGAIGTP